MQNTENSARYAAFKAKDARFDGRFFVGISSTGIYCRPVCPAKLAREENCTFYETAAAAEQAGFRPCLMCRPELAPGAAPIDAASVLAHKAARFLEENCGNGQNLEDAARRLGCSERHLRRVFVAEFKVSPVQYLQTCRLLLAKNLLTDTSLSVTDVAMAAGFGSLRRFNTIFRTRYHLSPTSLRKQISKEQEQGSAITLTLGYRPPYRWQQMLEFLALRAITGVEAVTDGEYMRTVRHVSEEGKEFCGWIRVGQHPKKDALLVTLSAGLLPALPHILGRVRHLFDLYCYPDAVYEILSVMNKLKPGLCMPGTRVPGCFEPFEMAVRAVLGQQITVKAACTLAGRLAATYGTPVKTGVAGLTHTFPSATDIVGLEGDISHHLGPLGIIKTRAATIYALAQKITTGDIDFDLCQQPEQDIQNLTSIPGIGVWTAQYIAMRALGWPDAFLHTDYGVKKALAPLTEKEILRLSELWRPWRSYATVNLWQSL